MSQRTILRKKMAANGEKDTTKNSNIPSIIILDSEDEEEQSTDELFEGFVKAVQPFLDRKELLLLRVKFQAVGQDFKGSSGFKDMLRRKINQVRQVDVYIHFNEVLNAVIRNAAVYGAIGTKKVPDNSDLSDENTSTGCQKRVLGAEASHNKNLAGNFENAEEDRPRMKITLNQSNELKDSEVEIIEDASLNQSTSSSRDFQSSKKSDPKKNAGEKEKMKMKRKKLVAKLESRLKYISEKIKRLSQAELSLEEMKYGDSSYIMESRLKKKFNNVWNKICKLKGRPPNTGRVIEGSITCKKTGFPAIDKAISKFLRKRQGFPDIFDVRNIIIRVNKKYSLGLTQGVQNDIAVDVLTDVGNKLQKKRKKDFQYNFGCHLTDDCLPSLDPALNSTELRQKLEENRRVNQTALEKVFEKYVHLGRVKGHVNKCSDVTSESDSESEKESDQVRRLKRNRKSSSGSESEGENSRMKHKKIILTDGNKKKPAIVNANELSVKSAASTSMSEKDKIFSLDVENPACSDKNTTDQSRRKDEILSLEVENSVCKDEKTTIQSGRKIKRDRKSSSNNESEDENSRMKHKKERTTAHDSKRTSTVVDANGIAVKGATSTSVLSEKDKIPSLDVENSECKDENRTANDSMQNSLVDGIGIVGKSVTLVSTPQQEELPSLDDRGSAGNLDVVMKQTDNTKKQKALINSTKLLSKIQELRENHLGKFIQNQSSINSSPSENQGADFCHSKRKSASVRHITQSQQLGSSSSNNSVENEVHNHTSDLKQIDDGKMQTADDVSKIFKQSVRITEESNSGISSPQSKKEISSQKESSVTIRNNVLRKAKATGLSVHSCSSSSEHSVQKGRLSSTSSPNGKFNLPKNVETVIIILDDDDD